MKRTQEQNRTLYFRQLEREKEEMDRRLWWERCQRAYADDTVSELI